MIFLNNNHAFIGIDMHKEQHTAVIIDCWLKVMGEITFANRPSKFPIFLNNVIKICGKKELVFGLEDTRGFGRNLAVFLVGHKYTVKSVNPALGNAIRLSSPTYEKNDSYDAYCVARVIRDMSNKLPDFCQPDIFWTIRQIVKRRDSIKKRYVILENQLHNQLMYNYPSYRNFFSEIDGKTALYFWEHYPSPMYLKGISAQALAEDLRSASRNACSTRKAEQILSLVEGDGDTQKQFQIERDSIIISVVRELKYIKGLLADIENQLKELLPQTGYKLETMKGINVVTAAQIISEVGDINRFPNEAKLSRFAGVAPISISSAGKGTEQRSRQGNRRLNAALYFLSVQVVQVSSSGKARQPVFREYFERKVREGKTKPQALVCIQRRLLRILYGMMKNKTEYIMPEIEGK